MKGVTQIAGGNVFKHFQPTLKTKLLGGFLLCVLSAIRKFPLQKGMQRERR